MVSPRIDRPKILLIPNIAGWIIAQMAMHIRQRFQNEFDFYFVPETLFWRRKDLCRTLLSHMNLVHCLNESSVELVLDLAKNREKPPPILTWIHHVTAWSRHHQLAADHSQALIACTTGWKQVIEKESGGRSPVQVVRHGVDSEFFSPRQDARRQLGIGSDVFLVGFFGTKGSDLDGQRKGVPVLIETLKRALPHIPRSQVIFVGPGWEPIVADLQKSGMAASCLGYVRHSDLPGLYSALDAYLMTSRIEGGPCTVLESMACETPVVATRVGLVPDVVIEGVNGFTAETGDADTLAAALRRLAGEPELAVRVSRAARETVIRHSWDENFTPLGDLYRKYAQPAAATGPIPAWMKDTERFWKVMWAADSVARSLDGYRAGGQPLGKSLHTLGELLSPIPVLERILGAAVVKGLAYR